MARKVKDYNLFKGYSWYTPGVGGMFALFGFFLLGVLIGNAVMLLIAATLGQDFAALYGTLIVYPVQFMPAMMYASFQSRRNAMFDTGYALDSRHFGPGGFALCAVVVVITTIAAAFAGDIINYGNYLLTEQSPLLSRFYKIVSDMMKQLTGGPVWVSLLSVSVMAPLFEEWLCRGEVLRGLLHKGMKPGSAIAVSALFFAVLHLNPWQALNAFLLGCLFGYVYYRTGSLWLTMLMHCANNTLAVIIQNIDTLKDYEFFVQIMPTGAYIAMLIVSVAVVAAAIVFLSKIPLIAPEGNSDPVSELSQTR